MNKKELKTKLREIFDKEDYDIDDKTLNESLEKVLGMRAFEVTNNKLVKYIPPSERPSKNAAKAK